MAKYRYVSLKCKKKRGPLRKCLLRIFSVAMCVTALAVCYMYFFISPLVREVARAKAASELRVTLDGAVLSYAEYELDYEGLVSISYGTDGTVTMLEYSAVKVSRAAYSVALIIQTLLNQSESLSASFPAGALTGLPFLSQTGREISTEIRPIGSVTCRMFSDFSTAGINQTRHRIYLEYSASVLLVLPLLDDGLTLSNQLLVSEAIIVGKVPDTYLQTLDTGNMFDLVPVK